MKKKFKIVLTLMCCFILAISFTGCSNKFVNDSKITTPINTEYPIVGNYEFKLFDDMNIVERVLGDSVNTIFFDKSNVYLDDKLYSGVNYKTRTVDVNQYTVYYLKCSKDELGLKIDKIDVISIYENSNLVADILNLRGDRILINIDGKAIPMEKTQKKPKPTSMSMINSMKDDSGELKQRNVKTSSTLLLGIRNMGYSQYLQHPSEEKYVYNTIGININDQEVQKIYRAPILIIPRKTGFWTIDNFKVSVPGFLSNIFESKSLTLGNKKSSFLERGIDNMGEEHYKQLTFEESRSKDLLWFPMDSLEEKNRINFVSDNYIGFEKVYILKDTKLSIDIDSIENYFMYSLDSIGNGPLKIEDMLSQDNSRSYANIKKSLNAKSQELSTQNFALKRKNGYWSVVNKVLDSPKTNIVNEIVLNIDPRKDIVKYDELPVSWSSIKDKIPFAIDGFCSPNKNAIVILTERKLYVFKVENNMIKDKLHEMNIEEGCSVIMAEWSVGEYAEKWMDICASY